MKHLTNLLTIIVLCVAPFLLSNSVQAQTLQIDTLVPDVQYQRKADRTYVFPMTQFIYPLGSNRYLHRWVDRPLFVDPALAKGKEAKDLMTLADYERMQEIAKQYGLDGFGLFPESIHKTMPFYDYTQQSSVKDFLLFPEFVNPGYNAAISKSDFVKTALTNSASFRIDGKIVIISYRTRESTFEKWKAALAELRQEFGDQFVFLAAPDFFDNPKAAQADGDVLYRYHHGELTQADIDYAKGVLRKWLSISDGIVYNNPLRLRRRWVNHRQFDADFYKNYVIRIIKSVLAEPEYKDKHLGLSAMVGFGNSTREGITISDEGTKALRSSMEAAISAQPEFIELPEWDEQNENDMVRPTVDKGMSTMRVMRYYMAKLKNEKLSPLPGDNISIPNLIVSFRKTLVLGETLKVELLNVPDTDKSTFYQARLTLKDAALGKTLHTSSWYRFDSKKMEDHTLVLPSEQFAQYRALVPQLEIKSPNGNITLQNGLPSLEFRTTANWNYNWFKQPIRDLLRPQHVDFNVGNTRIDGTRLVSADIQTQEPLASVEVVADDGDVVYSYPLPTDNIHAGWHENADQIILSINWQSFPVINLDGSIKLKNAQGRWLNLESGVGPRGAILPPFEGQEFPFAKAVSSAGPRQVLLAINKKDISKAEIEVNLKDIYQGTIPVSELLQKRIYGIAGRKGFNMVLSRYVSQATMPDNLHLSKVHFAGVPVLPDLKYSILKLRAIGISGRIYRSQPVVLDNNITNQKNITVFSDTQNRAVTISVPADRVPDIRYQFNPDHGSAIVADEARPFWGILGGYFALVTGRGSGNYGDDTSIVYREKNFPKYSIPGPVKDAVETAPEWIKTANDEYALKFNGKSTFLTLPQGVIPKRAASTVEMDIKPDNVTGQQVIIGNRNYAFGTYEIYLDNGLLKVNAQMSGYTLYTAKSTGLVLPANKWSHLTIRFDQENLQLFVDNQPGIKIPMKGPGERVTASIVGGIDDKWFAGEIKNLRIQHG